MKRALLVMALGGLLVSSMAFAAGVTGTKHDLSGTLTTGTQMCVFCHTPHGANVDAILAGTAPLWNQDLTATASFGVYDSGSFDATDIAAITNTAYSTSLLCLSCHDGTVAPGTFYNAPNPAGNTSSEGVILGGANLGNSLTTSHPVNFTYANSITNGDTGLVDPGPATFLDSAGKVQCSSCHDPHDNAATPDVNVAFMRDTLAGSALCLNCHIK
ncbi:MAG: cytochrome c3 family protein [Acidobacteriota bacterium]|nr:cytochrome c3 family protein [Acidobacteriota bacterium]